MSLDTVNAARGKWPGILAALGIDPKYLTGEHTPCPTGHGKDCFRFVSDDLNGKYFCSKCSKLKGDGFDLLAAVHGWDFKKTVSEVDRVVGRVPMPSTPPKAEKTDEEKAAGCKRLLSASGRVVPGTAAFRYLETRCGAPGAFHGDLWAHPGLRHKESGGIHPLLLGVMKYANGCGASVHRTYLTPDGRKAMVDPVRKMMPGLPLNGSSVHLGPVMPRMGIAEGIETALCAGNLFGLPVWAATCAGLLKTWEPPEGCREVVIFADNDESFTGQDAAFELAKRLCHLGIGWEIKIPPMVDTDWADVYMQEQQRGAA